MQEWLKNLTGYTTKQATKPTSTSESAYTGKKRPTQARPTKSSSAPAPKSTSGSRRYLERSAEDKQHEVNARRRREASFFASTLEPWVASREAQLEQALQYLAGRERAQPGLVQSMRRGVAVSSPNLEALFCSPLDPYGGWSDEKKVALATEAYLATWGTQPPAEFAGAVATRDPCLPRHVDELVRAFAPYTPEDVRAKGRIEAVQREAQALLAGTYAAQEAAAPEAPSTFFNIGKWASEWVDSLKAPGKEERATVQARFNAGGAPYRRRVEALAAGTVYDPNQRAATSSGSGAVIALLALAYVGGLFK